jgi:hypothetical protein
MFEFEFEVISFIFFQRIDVSHEGNFYSASLIFLKISGGVKALQPLWRSHPCIRLEITSILDFPMATLKFTVYSRN